VEKASNLLQYSDPECPYQRTSLRKAAARGEVGIFKMTDQWLPRTCKDSWQLYSDVLNAAARSGHLQLVDLLLEKLEKLEIKAMEFRPRDLIIKSLICAVRGGHHAVVERFLLHDKESAAERFKTAFSGTAVIAATVGDLTPIETLLAHAHRVLTLHDQAVMAQRAIEIATMRGDVTMVLRLLKLPGASPPSLMSLTHWIERDRFVNVEPLLDIPDLLKTVVQKVDLVELILKKGEPGAINTLILAIWSKKPITHISRYECMQVVASEPDVNRREFMMACVMSKVCSGAFLTILESAFGAHKQKQSTVANMWKQYIEATIWKIIPVLFRLGEWAVLPWGVNIEVFGFVGVKVTSRLLKFLNGQSGEEFFRRHVSDGKIIRMLMEAAGTPQLLR
jgi:hypothetical protein